jgi:two-component system response regulator HydG
MSDDGRGGRARILVVDDEPDVREMMCTLLAAEGYEVVAVEGGLQALSAAQRTRFDLVTMDLRMPGMGGREALSRLRALDPAIQVLVVSGYATPEESEACMALGAYAVVRKPLDILRLLVLVEHALARRRAARADRITPQPRG